METKSLLKTAIYVMVIIGIGLISIAFLQSMNMNMKQENDAWATCDLSDMAPGTIKECGYGRVYKRTQADKDSISMFTHLLADPEMIESGQPELAKNKWRSENEDYFIFYPWAPVRRCGVSFQNTKSENLESWKPSEYEAIKKLPYFTEPCERRTWDTSGRLYARKHFPPENNLIVPNVKWKSDTNVLIPSPSY